MSLLERCKVGVIIFLCGNFISTSEGQTTALVCDADIYPQIVECPPWEDGVPTYIPYPYDCRKFIECTNGNPVVQCCPPGTVWDQQLLVCNHESVTPCIIVTTGPTTLNTNPTLSTPIITSETTTIIPIITTPTTTTPTTTTPTTTPTTTTTTTPTTTMLTTTTPTTTTPTTTTPTTTTPTTTTPTITMPTTTTPTTTTPTTTTPTTTTATTTTPTTTTPTTTTTTPTTTTPTTTTPTTTTPTTTTPTTTTPTTTTPTTTTPTTTTPTTTTPTTTTPTTTTPTTRPPTTTQRPIHDGYSFTITNGYAPTMALTNYNATVRNGNKIHAAAHAIGCTDLSQVWKFEFDGSKNSSYILYSALRDGNGQQWIYNLHAGSTPHFHRVHNPHNDHEYWTFVPVEGSSTYFTFTNHAFSTNMEYTGVPNPLGIDLEMEIPRPDDPLQWWRLRRC